MGVIIKNGISYGGYISDYDNLKNKPSINSVELSGNKTASQLGLVNESDIITLSMSEFEALETKTAKFYFIYADPKSTTDGGDGA